MKLQRFFAMAIPLFLLACDYNSESKKSQTSNQSGAQSYSVDSISFGNMQAGPQQPIPKEPEKQNQPPNTRMIDWDKKIVKNADLSLGVNNSRKYRQSLTEWVRASGGYFAKEEQIQKDNWIETDISIKVPVEQFDVLLDNLITDSVKVISKSVNTEDVTGEYVDIRSRLESKRQVRLRYLDFLKQAKNMEEVLLVQNEVNELQEQMESAAGRISYLSQASAFSSIHLKFSEIDPNLLPKQEDPSYLLRLFESLKKGSSWIGEVILFVFSIWPFFIVVLGIALWFKKKSKANTQKPVQV